MWNGRSLSGRGRHQLQQRGMPVLCTTRAMVQRCKPHRKAEFQSNIKGKSHSLSGSVLSPGWRYSEEEKKNLKAQFAHYAWDFWAELPVFAHQGSGSCWPPCMSADPLLQRPLPHTVLSRASSGPLFDSQISATCKPLMCCCSCKSHVLSLKLMPMSWRLLRLSRKWQPEEWHFCATLTAEVLYRSCPLPDGVMQSKKKKGKWEACTKLSPSHGNPLMDALWKTAALLMNQVYGCGQLCRPPQSHWLEDDSWFMKNGGWDTCFFAETVVFS